MENKDRRSTSHMCYRSRRTQNLNDRGVKSKSETPGRRRVRSDPPFPPLPAQKRNYLTDLPGRG